MDSSGNAYVTGLTSSSNFPTTAGSLPFSDPGSKYSFAFVTKLNAAGTGLVYSTYLGGSGFTLGSGIAVDSSGDAYVTGRTSASNFPTVHAFQSKLGGGTWGDAFVARLNATGSALLYSSYLGGNGDENEYISGNTPVGGIAVDDAGNAYLTGTTTSTNFPTTSTALQPTSGNNASAFVVKVNTNLAGSASLTYSTYLAGMGFAIATDGAGNAYVTGLNAGAFVAKLNTNVAGAAGLVYSTSFGPGVGYGIAVDGAGNAYVTGETNSSYFPTTANAFQTASVALYQNDAFLTVLNASGSGLLYSTYLGGSATDYGRAIALDSSGHVYLTGYTAGNFPILNAFQSTLGGSLGYTDAFVAELDPSQSGAASLIYSSYLGGSGADYGYGIAVDSAGNAYVTGSTVSTNVPTLNAFQPSSHGSYDAFVTKIDPPPTGASATAASSTGASGTVSSAFASQLPLDRLPASGSLASGGQDQTTAPAASGNLLFAALGWPLFPGADLPSHFFDAAALADAVFAQTGSFLLTATDRQLR